MRFGNTSSSRNSVLEMRCSSPGKPRRAGTAPTAMRTKRASSSSSHTVAVGDDELDARFVLIAVGAVPARLGLPGEEHLISSTEFLELEVLPKRIGLAGGGYITAEVS